MSDIAHMLRSREMRDFTSALSQLRTINADTAAGLLESLATEEDLEFKCRAVAHMFEFSRNRGAQLAMRFLKDPDDAVRLNALSALLQMHADGVVDILIDSLQHDPEDAVRCWAAFNLGKVGDVSAIVFLENAAHCDKGADDEGRLVRDIALTAIEKIRQRRNAIRSST